MVVLPQLEAKGRTTPLLTDMIFIKINEDKFAYDIHSLVKAFFPSEDVKVLTELHKEENADYEVTFSPDRMSFFAKEGKLILSKEVPIGTDKPEEKNILKRLIYESLSTLLNKSLSWGDLTGIRPTKIPAKLLLQGKTDEEILKYMKDTYYISDEKGLLAIDIAKREHEILRPLHEKGYSIYIGIPFCPTTCLYCSFTSNPIAMWKDRLDAYLDALEKEIVFTKNARAGKTLDTIYIGGGTPTTLDAKRLERLMRILAKNFDLSKLLEFTVEAGRADSITIDKLKVLKQYGVTRISVNPQTMNQKTLDFIGRRHTVEDTIRAYHEARSEGFDNINMDIILGLPGEGETEVRHTIEEIKRLKPDSLTVHSLAVKRGSRLYERIVENGYTVEMINTPAIMKIAEEGAYAMDMKPYYLYRQKNMAGNFENTGYAREGAFGIYNILIMEELEPIVAMGPGSVSKVITKEGKLVRSDNVKDVSLYIDKIDEMLKRKEELFSLE